MEEFIKQIPKISEIIFNIDSYTTLEGIQSGIFGGNFAEIHVLFLEGPEFHREYLIYCKRRKSRVLRRIQFSAKMLRKIKALVCGLSVVNLAF